MWERNAGISWEVVPAFLYSISFRIVKFVAKSMFRLRILPVASMYAQSLIERLWKERSRCVLA